MELKSASHIKSQTVVKLILDKIKDMILSNDLQPGDCLPSENEMAELFGVGKSSIREVIKMLDAVGVIESKQGHGTFICGSPREDCLNPLIFQFLLLKSTGTKFLEFQKMFETAYTLMAMDNMTEDDKKYISKLLEAPRTAVEDTDFHRAILRSTHNPYVIRTGEILIDLYQNTLGGTTNSNVMLEYDTSADHRKIFAAVCNKDRDALEEILRKSFEAYGLLFL